MIKDYDVGINYHPGKANVVADVLSWKSYCNRVILHKLAPQLSEESELYDLGFLNDITAMEIQHTLMKEIREAQ